MESLKAALADRYRLERELGAGGMATVFLAEDLRHRRKVAVKVLRPELAAVIGAARFLSEIQTTAHLQHPQILPLFDSGQVDGTVFYVMPFIEGNTLRDRITREKQLPVADAVRIASEVAGALDYAHRQGVIHRDIKPENILLHDGRALVADFGIALAASRTEGGARMTETGMSLGTPHYMSPEQALGERELDPRTDIYALGCVLYEMLSGEPPFDGPTAQAIVAKVMSSDPEPITSLRRTVPEHVAAAIDTALQKVPADRFASAREFADVLAGTTAAPTRRWSPGAPALRKTSPGTRVVPWVIAALALAVAAFVLWRAGARPGPEPVRFAFEVEGIEEGTTPGRSIAISPNGGTIVVAGQSAGRRVLFRRDIDDLQPRPILGTEGGFEPVISPDGREVAFATGDRRLMRVSIDGGAPVPLVGVTTPIGMAWSAKHGLVLGMPMHSQTIRGLSLVSTRGDTEVRPLMDSVEGMHHDPLVLPDGMTALYVDVADSGPASHGVGVASLDDGAVERVADLPVFGDGGVIGLKDGILYFLSPSRDLMGVRFDLAKRRIVGTPVRLTDPLGAARDVIMAPDGTVVMRVAPSAFQAASVSALGVATPLHPDTLEVISGRYSPDGRRILLFESRADKPAWWIQDVATGTRAKVEVKGMPALPRASWMPDGRGLIAVQIGGSHVLSVPVNAGDTAKVLGRFEGMQLNTASLSPDGKTLVLGAGIGAGEKDILTARLGADTVPTPFVASTANEVAASFSPDGRWIVFASDESGRYEVYVLPFPGPGPRIQISDSGGGQPIWGRDGRRIYYRSGQAMMAADLGGPANSLTVSNRRLLFRGYFFQPDPGLFAAVYDVSPDGRHFIMGRPLSNSNRSEIVVWKNWHEEVKQRLK